MSSVQPNKEGVIFATMGSDIDKLIGPKTVSFFPERAPRCEDDYRRTEAMIYIKPHMPRLGPYQVFRRLHHTRFQDRDHRSRRMSVRKDIFLTHNMVFPKSVPSQFGFPHGYNLISLGLRLVALTFDYDEEIPHIQLTEYAWRPLSLRMFPHLEEFTLMCLRPIGCNYQSRLPFLNSSTNKRELALAGEDLVNGLFPCTIVRLWIVGQRRGRYRMPKELEWTHLDLYSEFSEHYLNRMSLILLTRMRLENPIREETCKMVV